jgi:hypothetical protein
MHRQPARSNASRAKTDVFVSSVNEVNNPLRLLGVLVDLDKSYRAEEIKHFRFVLEVQRVQTDPPLTLYLAGRDAHVPTETGLGFGEHILVRSETKVFQDTRVGAQATQSELVSSTILTDEAPFKLLRDLEGVILRVWVNESLTKKIDALAFVVNDYVLLDLPGDRIRACRPVPEPNWFLPLAPEEAADPWVSIGIETDQPVIGDPSRMQVWTMFALGFSATPHKLEHDYIQLRAGDRAP